MIRRPASPLAVGVVAGVPVALALQWVLGDMAAGGWIVLVVWLAVYGGYLLVSELPLVVIGAAALICVGCRARS